MQSPGDRLRVRLFGIRGYSLIELLTVITIVSIVTSLLVTAVGTVKEAARRTHAQTDLAQLVGAVRAYYLTYGVYPVRRDQEGAEITFTTDNSELMNVLRDVPEGANTEHRLNPKQIRFLEVSPAGDPAHPRSGICHGCWYDPWGPQQSKPESGVYHVRIDGAYKNEVTDPYPGVDADEGGAVPPPTIKFGVIAWSLAKGGVQTYELLDQVISWK
jgi:prepilin-type N-terminal cleavage/methylation domain-containing protein